MSDPTTFVAPPAARGEREQFIDTLWSFVETALLASGWDDISAARAELIAELGAFDFVQPRLMELGLVQQEEVLP